MDGLARHTVEVCFSPRLFEEIERGENEIVVLVDILRASTSVCSAIANGATSILPVATIEAARELKKQGFLVASEQDGVKVDFADFDNSSFSFTPRKVYGKTIAYCTTNGTHALSLAGRASLVAIGAFINLSALKIWLIQQQQPVIILCSGWKNRFCLEDALFAGALADQLLESDSFWTQCDSTLAAMDLWCMARTDVLSYINKASHYQRLKQLALDDVVPYSFRIDQTDVVPVYDGVDIRNRTI